MEGKKFYQEAYQGILNAWDSGDGMNDMYHHILYFLESGPEKIYPKLKKSVENWLKRATRGDETYDLVEEFLFGDRYEDIRRVFTNHNSESESNS